MLLLTPLEGDSPRHTGVSMFTGSYFTQEKLGELQAQPRPPIPPLGKSKLRKMEKQKHETAP